MMVAILLSFALATALLFLAVATLHSASDDRAVIAFLLFGLVTALAWAWLDAPDVALAEAAIGAGATGALLLAQLKGAGPRRRRD